MRARIRVVCVAAVLAVAAGVVHAQIWRGGFGFYAAPKHPTATTFAGGFNHCRLMFTSDHREKRGWSTDYPGADINFSVRLGELTRTRITKDKTGDPDYITVSAQPIPTLFQCPYILVEDGGSARFSDEEVLGCASISRRAASSSPRTTGARAPANSGTKRSDACCRREKYPIIDLPPSIRSGSRCSSVKEVPQMASIQFWRRSGGGISERGEDSSIVEAKGIADAHGRLMVVMVHNSDIPDGWEREAEDPQYFYKFSPDAYSVGIDVVLYAMTH